MTDPRMTPTNDAPVTVDPTGFEWPTEAAWQAMSEAEILNVLANQRAHLARHRLAALASAPAGDWLADAIRVLTLMNASRWSSSEAGDWVNDNARQLLEALARPRAAVGEQSRVQEIIDLWFAPWGAAKSEQWEDLSGDRPFDPNVALELIRDALQSPPAKVEG